MHRIRLVLAALFAILLIGPAAAAPPVDWVNRVALSPIGGHVEGNPAAPTKLVEYVSYTCSHCAHFVAEATGPLNSGYVRTGKVSVEVRNAVRDRYDLTAALIARCGGPRRFMGNHVALFANQPAWFDAITSYEQNGTPPPSDEKAALREIGQKTGLYAVMAKRGFTPAQLDACINNPASMKAVLAMTEEAWKKVQIKGTPGFTVNGTLVQGSSWEILQAALPPPAR